MKNVAVVDYGNGNANSIRQALLVLGLNSVYSAEPDVIGSAEYIILPGVGHFGSAMKSLHDSELIDSLNHAALTRRVPILGICLGMQIMTRFSEEGFTNGLNWIDAETKRINPSDKKIYKVPHVGWNTVKPSATSTLLKGIDVINDPFYFCHSFAIDEVESKILSVTVEYDRDYVAIFEQNNIFGVQFHPEKSQDSGLKLLKNFLSISD